MTVTTRHQHRGQRLAIGLGLLVGLSGLACKGRKLREGTAETSDDAAAREAAALLAQRPVKRPDGPGLEAGRYRLLAIDVEAEPTKARKKPWDPEPLTAPDLTARIRVDGTDLAECKMSDDALSGRCRFDEEFVLDETTTITVDVTDRDSLFDDVVGSATLDRPGTWGVAVGLPMIVHDRVRTASLVLARAPTWWFLHRVRVIGAIVGVLAALGVVGRFRRSLLAPDPIPKVPRCAFCSRTLAEGALKCGHCGAAQ